MRHSACLPLSSRLPSLPCQSAELFKQCPHILMYKSGVASPSCYFKASPLPQASLCLFTLFPGTTPVQLWWCSVFLPWTINCHQSHLTSAGCHVFCHPHNPRVESLPHQQVKRKRLKYWWLSLFSSLDQTLDYLHLSPTNLLWSGGQERKKVYAKHVSWSICSWKLRRYCFELSSHRESEGKGWPDKG